VVIVVSPVKGVRKFATVKDLGGDKVVASAEGVRGSLKGKQ